MGLKRIWSCDKCGRKHEMDSQDTTERPPSGWQVISFCPSASIVQKLLCRNCMAQLYAELFGKTDAGTSTEKAAYRRGVLDTFDVLANYLGNGELRQIHTFAKERQDEDFDPARLLLAWVNDPGPETKKESAHE